MNNNTQTDVLIIGGGWAGLSAAIKLIDNGKSVCILEAAKQLGGRARQVQYKEHSVDNGTHIMVGAYIETLRLIKKVHTISHNGIASKFNESDLLERQELSLHYKQLNNTISIPHISLPAPFNIIFSFLFTKGITIKEKILILSLGSKIKLNRIKLTSDINLKEFLIQQRQTERIIQIIWEPLCLAIMNTPIKLTSTEIFLHVIKDAFFKSRCASDLLFFKTNLSDTFPTPAQNYIKKHGGEIKYVQAVTSLKKEQDYYIASTRTHSFQAKDIIIATAPIATKKILESLIPNAAVETLLHQLTQFNYQPICTVYLQYPDSVQCERIMQGFIGTTSQWMFDRSLTNQAGFISIIISSEGSHMEWDNPKLIKEVTNELNQFYPHWPQPIDAFVIREKRATFTASVNINRIRPTNKTDINNIWLAGDYTNTYYPATLEGAVRSGLLCAEQILLESQ